MPGRIRATLGQVRQLESELRSATAELVSLRDKVALLERSNDLMDSELGLARSLNDVYKQINDYLYKRIKERDNRNWFMRLFNL